jgi:outer membrane protein assembly factor BamB
MTLRRFLGILFFCVLGVSEAGATKHVKAPDSGVFQLHWWKPVVRTGTQRTVLASFGAPALFLKHGFVLVATSEGDVVAFQVENGQEVWRQRVGIAFESGVTRVVYQDASNRSQEAAVVGSRDGVLRVLDPASGRTLWQAQVQGEIRAGPVVEQNRLFVATHRNRVVVFDMLQGTELWSQARTGPMGLSIEGHARPVVVDHRVYVGYSDGMLCAYDAEEGSLLWSRLLASSSDPTAFLDIDTDPVVSQGLVFVASYEEGVYALDSSTGETVWHQKTPSVTALAVAHGRVITVSGEGFVRGWSVESGALLYSMRTQPQAFSRITVRGGVALASAGSYGLLVWDAQTGRPLQAKAVLGEAGSDVDWVDGVLALVSKTGHLYVWRQRPLAAG